MNEAQEGIGNKMATAEIDKPEARVIGDSLDTIESSIKAGDRTHAERLLKAVHQFFEERPQDGNYLDFMRAQNLQEELEKAESDSGPTAENADATESAAGAEAADQPAVGEADADSADDDFRAVLDPEMANTPPSERGEANPADLNGTAANENVAQQLEESADETVEVESAAPNNGEQPTTTNATQDTLAQRARKVVNGLFGSNGNSPEKSSNNTPSTPEPQRAQATEAAAASAAPATSEPISADTAKPAATEQVDGDGDQAVKTEGADDAQRAETAVPSTEGIPVIKLDRNEDKSPEVKEAPKQSLQELIGVAQALTESLSKIRFAAENASLELTDEQMSTLQEARGTYDKLRKIIVDNEADLSGLNELDRNTITVFFDIEMKTSSAVVQYLMEEADHSWEFRAERLKTIVAMEDESQTEADIEAKVAYLIGEKPPKAAEQHAQAAEWKQKIIDMSRERRPLLREQRRQAGRQAAEQAIRNAVDTVAAVAGEASALSTEVQEEVKEAILRLEANYNRMLVTVDTSVNKLGVVADEAATLLAMLPNGFKIAAQGMRLAVGEASQQVADATQEQISQGINSLKSRIQQGIEGLREKGRQRQANVEARRTEIRNQIQEMQQGMSEREQNTEQLKGLRGWFKQMRNR